MVWKKGGVVALKHRTDVRGEPGAAIAVLGATSTLQSECSACEPGKSSEKQQKERERGGGDLNMQRST